jgi:hypothetical protein
MATTGVSSLKPSFGVPGSPTKQGQKHTMQQPPALLLETTTGDYFDFSPKPVSPRSEEAQRKLNQQLVDAIQNFKVEGVRKAIADGANVHALLPDGRSMRDLAEDSTHTIQALLVEEGAQPSKKGAKTSWDALAKAYLRNDPGFTTEGGERLGPTLDTLG